MTTLHSFTLNGAPPLAAWASPDRLRALPDTLIDDQDSV
jgi:hypothetical protein